MDKLMTPYVKIPGMLSEAIKNDYNLLTFFSPQEKCFRLIFANYTWNGYVNRFYNATEEDFRVEDVVFVNGNFSSPKFDEFRKKKDLEIEETKIMMEEEKMFENFEKQHKVITFKTNKCDVCDKGRIVLRIGRHGAFGGCTNFPNCKNTLSDFELAREQLDQSCNDCPETYRQIQLVSIGNINFFAMKCDKCQKYEPIFENINNKEDLDRLAIKLKSYPWDR